MKHIKLFENYRTKDDVMGFVFETTATYDEKSQKFRDFGLSKTAMLYGKKESDIIKVKCEVIEVGCPENPQHDAYWRFYNNKNEKVSLIWGSWYQFFVCFTYGPF